MANKLLMLLLLLGWGVSAQSITVTTTTNIPDFIEFIERKDSKIDSLQQVINRLTMSLRDSDDVNMVLVSEIDSLTWYKKYYKHSKHVIGPRIIKRIEEMVSHE